MSNETSNMCYGRNGSSAGTNLVKRVTLDSPW